MFRNRLWTAGLRASAPHREGLRTTAVNYAGSRRRHASSAATEITHDVRQKTMEELGGPSFLTTLNWLFLKGYLPKTQQMQVSGARARPACVSLHPQRTFLRACLPVQTG